MSYYLQKTLSETMSRRLFFVAVFSTLMGIMVLIGVCVYMIFGLYTDSSLKDLNTSARGPLALPEPSGSEPQASDESAAQEDRSTSIEVIRKVQPVPEDKSASIAASANQLEADAASPIEKVEPSGQSNETAKSAPSKGESLAGEVSDTVSEPADFDASELILSYSDIYPGHQTHPKYWDSPLTAGADEYAYGVVSRHDRFVEVSSEDGMPKGTLSDAARILIPSIDIDSKVSNLAILDIGDSKQYETPAHVVGRIPETSNPGEIGNTWLFGHLESPVLGEGSVFRRLPEIPEILKNGDPVYVTLANEDGEEFIYQITSTTVMHRDDLKLSDTDDSTITLVTCVPRLIYDRRLVVSGKLVGVKKPA